MVHWSSLVVLSLAVASSFGHPKPDEDAYNIPDVGNNRRSQYYVLHDDGSFKYGYDTGENAFESQKTNVRGDVNGKFGYTDSDGQDYNIQYTSGTSGFVAQGDHIPKVHPDVAAAFAAARSAGPFVDPLAGEGGDRSYQFEFDGEEHSRNEVSDDDGTVTGSYSYIDEFGRTRSYTYRAGKGIGFVIEGDDIPQQVQPLPVPSTTQVGTQRQTTFRAGSSINTGSGATNRFSHGASHGASHRASGATRTQTRVGHSGAAASTKFRTPKPANTYFPPSTGTGSTSTSTRFSQQSHASQSRKPSPAFSSGVSSGASATRHTSAGSAHRASAGDTRTTGFTRTAGANTRQFEAANTRISSTPSGSYSLAYETSSHSRQEAGDDDNNVRGQFSFTSDDDDDDRTVTYEAGSATGFIAQGAHLPVGPPVPGALSGQVTGRFDAVERSEFVDPLADDDSDASYDFGFDSDTYSRSETADEDGNVSGTYSVLGEDGILRTYRFRAGKGIGYETEEISAVQTGRKLSSTNRQASSFAGSASRTGSAASRSGISSSKVTGTRIGGGTTFGAQTVSTYKAPTKVATHGSRASAQSASVARTTATQGGNTGFSSKFSNVGSSQSSARNELSRRFTLHQYDASRGTGKYGYVLKFDD